MSYFRSICSKAISVSGLECYTILFRRQGGQLTWEIQAENGKPLSLAKAQISRDVVARAVILPEKIRTSRLMAKNRAVPVLPVFENKFRYGRSESIIEFSGPIVYSIVMTITNAMEVFRTYDHHMACGTVKDASLTSSATKHCQLKLHSIACHQDRLWILTYMNNRVRPQH